MRRILFEVKGIIMNNPVTGYSFRTLRQYKTEMKPFNVRLYM